MIAATEFRNAMSLLSTAVNIITTAGDSGWQGLTASAVCSVTDTPPSLLVCLNQSSRSHAHFLENGILAVNVLAADQEALAKRFALSQLTAEQRFQWGAWSQLETGAPVLQEALISFDCEITEVHPVSTHSVLICRVLAIHRGQAQEGLLYFNRAYHTVGAEAEV